MKVKLGHVRYLFQELIADNTRGHYHKDMSILRKISGFILTLIVFLVTLYLLLAFLNRSESEKLLKISRISNYEKIKRGSHKEFERWSLIGHLEPNSFYRQYLVDSDGELLFDVIYKMNKFGLRNEGPVKPVQEFKSHLIIGGCSFVFGTGLNAEETLSSSFRATLKNANVVNFGHGGGGLHTQLKALDIINLKEFVKENRGTFIYVFYSDHLNRWHAKPSYLIWGLPRRIHYEIQHGELKSMSLSESGQFKDFQKVKASGQEMNFVKAKAISGPNWKEEELEDFSEGVRHLKEKYLKLYPQGKFLVVFHPPFNIRNVSEKMGRFFKVKNIDYFDPTYEFEKHMKMSQTTLKDFQIPLDGHPNQKLNKFLAESIIKWLALR